MLAVAASAVAVDIVAAATAVASLIAVAVVGTLGQSWLSSDNIFLLHCQEPPGQLQCQ